MMNDVITTLPRSKSAFVTQAELRALLKSNLGLNARQVTVRKGHSTTWLTITVRDPSVDLAAVKAFARPFDTSYMDQTDYHSGQSVEVDTTTEVDDAHAAPHIEEIKLAVERIKSGQCGCGTKLSNGKRLWSNGRDYYVMADLNSIERGCYIWGADVESGNAWAIRALAIQMARVGVA
jgi:hypothetical protein